jgi:hypothetical protein
MRLLDVNHEFRHAMLEEIPHIIHAMRGVAA